MSISEHVRYSPGLLDMYPQLNRVRLKISALTNFGIGDNILKVPRCPRLLFRIYWLLLIGFR